MSKLISEADRLLEKGKIREALEKLKAAQKAEPLNQLVATKLANAYVDNGESDKAVKVFVSLADRLSEAGKAQVAIAIYKQALELDPADISLKVKFAIECEAAGKMSDAQSHANFALNHYLPRKKYFDAANLMPMLVRLNGKDERLKSTWIEILQLSQADQKLIHLLVALCGPPGLVSEEFSVGGEPSALSPVLYESLKKLVPYFPRDPKLAYAVAWSAQRRGNLKDFYHYLRECLRRDPDFCLALLLFARTLAEQQKLNEALFVYKHLRERVMADKSVDMATLNRLIDGFVEKNGWISFNEGDPIDVATFIASFMPGSAASPAAAAAPAVPSAAPSVPPPAPPSVSAAPIPPPAAPESIAAAPLDPLALFGLSPDPNAPAAPVTSTDPLASAEAAPSATPVTQSAAPSPAPAAPMDAVDIFASAPASPTPPESPAQDEEDLVEKGSPTSLIEKVPEVGEGSEIALGAEAESEMEVQFTSETRLIKLPKAKTGSEAVPVSKSTSAATPQEAAPAPVPPAEKNSSPKVTFNPFESSAPKVIEGEALKPALESGDKTQMFSPLELLDAADRVQAKSADVKTKVTLNRPEDLAEVLSPRADLPLQSPEAEAAAAGEQEPEEQIEGAPTQLFSPFEALDAGAASRRPYGAGPSNSSPEEMAVPEPVGDGDGATVVMPIGGMAPAAPPPANQDIFASSPEAPPVGAPNVSAESPDFIGGAGGAFMPIPDQVAAAENASSSDGIDLGDDLLQDPTRILVVKPPADATSNLVRELEGDLAGEKGVDADFLLRKSERYIAKRNYYMARKLLRHALAVGGDEARIKERLRDIRKLELPESLYSAISSDEGAKEGSEEILSRLEEEFDLNQEENEAAAELAQNVDFQMENIFRETDPRTILDFGVALHEMGLFRQAETVFARLVDEFPETSFDAYYLAAISKFARKDYAGAASILKTLSADGGKTDLEKIQVYYVLGELFEKMQRPDSSKEFYRKVAEIDANYRNIRHKLEE